MTFIGVLFIIIYLFVYFKSLVNLSKGKFEYLLYFICLTLPFYNTLQSQLFEIFGSVLLVNVIKFSKDLIFVYALVIFLFGQNKSIIERKFNFSLVDKLFICFVLIIIFYTVIPIGDANFFSKIIYSKNILLFPLVYFIGRNLDLNYNTYNSLNKVFLVVFLISFVFVFFEFIFTTHFHTLINYSNYNFIINDIEPQGNYGLSWSFESQGSKPRYASFFSDPLEFSASLILFFSFALYYFYNNFKKEYLFVIVLIVFSLVLSFSRGPILAFILVLLFSLLLNKKYSLLIKSILILSTLSIVVYFSVEKEIQYLIEDTLTFRNSSSLSHLIEWIEAIISMTENPFGIGLAMSGNAGGVDQTLKVGGENQFLIYGVQMGLLSMLLYIIIIASVIYRSYISYQQSEKIDKHISFIVSCSKFGLLIPLITANAEIYLFVSLSTWLLAGYSEKIYQNLSFEKN